MIQMKRTWIILLVCIAALFCLPVSAAEGAAPAFSTDPAELKLADTRGGNYIMSYREGQGFQTSWLCENASGGLTLVQYSRKAITAAEFDKDLQFVRMCKVPLENVYRWGGFCTDGTYNYVVFAADQTTLQINRYTMDWQLDATVTHTPDNTTSFLQHGCDVAVSGGVLTIATTHYMENRHQANLLLQFNTALSLLRECSGVYTYEGYSSHAYFPEVTYSGGWTYTAEMCDSIPGEGISLTKHTTLGSGQYRTFIHSRSWQDLGALGNMIPGPNGGILAAYAHAKYVLNEPSIEQADAYLVWFNGESNTTKNQRITDTGMVGTPYVAPLDAENGYVMWNPEPRADLDSDLLHYARYTISGGSLVVGAVKTAPHTWLTDCEPISWQGAVIWFAWEDGELVFYQLDADGNLTATRLHSFEPLEGQAPTCTAEGWTDGQQCTVCGLRTAEVLPMVPHNPVPDAAVDPTCTEPGQTAGTRCGMCREVLEGCEPVAAVGHRGVEVAEIDPTCTEPGMTAGVRCEACDQVLEGCERISPVGHWDIDVGGQAPTCSEPGWMAGKKCLICGRRTGKMLNMLPHTPEPGEEIAPTCTEPGWTAGSRCRVCKQALEDCEPIPATGHRAKSEEEILPSCTEPGRTAGVRCETCGETLSGCIEIAAAGHQQEIPEIRDCTKDLCCTVCGEVTEPARNREHGFRKVETYWPDCTNDGWALYRCASCEVEMTEVIETPGHAWIMSHCADCGLESAEAVRNGDTLTIRMPHGADGAVMLVAEYDRQGKYLGMTRWDWDLMHDGPDEMTVPLDKDCGSWCAMFFFYEPFRSPARPALKG